MRNLVSRFKLAHILILAASAALGCGTYGGQSFDDGNDDLGHAHSEHEERGEHVLASLEQQASVSIRSPEEPFHNARYVDALSGSIVGDLDADGYADLALLVQDLEERGGTVHVFYGRPDFPAELSTEAADFTITATDGPLTALGDLNGDGRADFGFRGQDTTYEGETWTGFSHYVVFGAAERRSGVIAATELESSLHWSGSVHTIRSIAGAGDVNGDGYTDLVAAGLDRTYLVLGRSEPFGRLLVPNDAVELFRAPDRVLQRAAAGDIDGDGYADLLLDSALGTALYYGRAEGWEPSPTPVEPDAVLQGKVQALGDWDGDGYSDLAQVIDLVPYPDSSLRPPLTPVRHELLLSYGGPERMLGALALPRPPADSISTMGATVAWGDLNGDRQLDLVVGSPYNPQGQDEEAGAVFVLPGSARPRDEKITLTEADAALRGQGTSGMLGLSVSASGDANGDGFQDVLVMRSRTEGNAIDALLVFGSDSL